MVGTMRLFCTPDTQSCSVPLKNGESSEIYLLPDKFCPLASKIPFFLSAQCKIPLKSRIDGTSLNHCYVITKRPNDEGTVEVRRMPMFTRVALEQRSVAKVGSSKTPTEYMTNNERSEMHE